MSFSTEEGSHRMDCFSVCVVDGPATGSLLSMWTMSSSEGLSVLIVCDLYLGKVRLLLLLFPTWGVQQVLTILSNSCICQRIEQR